MTLDASFGPLVSFSLFFHVLLLLAIILGTVSVFKGPGVYG
jgi:uncharacterized membrane protein (DUF106 family)